MLFRTVGGFFFLLLLGFYIRAWQKGVFRLTGLLPVKMERLTPDAKPDRLRQAVLIFVLICLGGLAISGLFPAVLLGKPPSGILLALHLLLAPLFSVGVVGFALLMSHRSRFTAEDWRPLKAGNIDPNFNRVLLKLLFWLGLLATFLSIFSILVEMFNIFGTPSLRLFSAVHRWSGLVLFSTAALAVLVCGREKPGVEGNGGVE